MLSSPGIGSGLDVNGIISQLIAVEQRPLIKLDGKEASQQAQLSAYGSLKGVLSSFQSSAKALANSTIFTGNKASLADSALATVTAFSTAAKGTYQIEVQALAQAQKIKSESFNSIADTIGSGSLTIEFGTYNADGTFTDHPTKASSVITIEPGQSSLADIRDAINQANVSVTASIINDGIGNKLVIASNDTGLSNALKITTNDDDGNHTDNSGLSKLAYDASIGGTSNMTETVVAKDSTIILDGITINKSSNTITDALGGVTINLLKENLGTSTSLTVTQDTTKVQTAVSAFVNSYNELGKTISDLSKYDTENKRASILTGDSTVRAVQTQIRNILGSALPGIAGELNTLSQVGISFQKDGTLALDSSKLSAALSDPAKNVTDLFANDGIAVKLDKLIDSMLKNDGLIDGRMDGINASITDINKQREALVTRLENVEKRYRAQFSALDTMIASMTQTSNFLQQQLSRLPTIDNG